jgi:hypothetical protein
MSLAIISVKKAIHLWSDLEKAYFGVNGFGGHTAEIYAHRIKDPAPSLGFNAERDKESHTELAVALYDILSEFKESRNCSITVNDKKLGSWLKREEFAHRVHVKIVPNKNNHDWKYYQSNIQDQK